MVWTQRNTISQIGDVQGKLVRFWPYKILRRNDDELRTDLKKIMRHFSRQGVVFDMVVFVPNAGKCLSDLFIETFGEFLEVNFLTVRRSSTVAKESWLKKIVFERQWLADAMRHLDVLLRLIRYKFGLDQKMVVKFSVDFDVKGKKVLVIDDDIATGTTLSLVKSILVKHGASSVTTSCISNHFLPDEIEVDYSVYRYALLRTKNSRDYHAN